MPALPVAESRCGRTDRRGRPRRPVISGFIARDGDLLDYRISRPKKWQRFPLKGGSSKISTKRGETRPHKQFFARAGFAIAAAANRPLLAHKPGGTIARMGKRGPPPQPVALAKLKGTYQPVRHAKRTVEPEAPGDLAQCKPPRWLTRRQRAIWTDLMKRAPRGILRAIDRELVAVYCELVDRHQRAAAAQAKLDAGEGLPLVVRGAAGLAPSPYLRIMNQAALLMVRMQSEMGFSPAGRAILGQPEPPRAPAAGEDTWATLRRFPVIDGGKRS
jgi:P27 family predicted phage terminase small subunit